MRALAVTVAVASASVFAAGAVRAEEAPVETLGPGGPALVDGKRGGPLSTRLAGLVRETGAGAGGSAADVGIRPQRLPASGPGSLLRQGDRYVVSVRLHTAGATALAAVLTTGAERIAVNESGDEVSVAATPEQIVAIADLSEVRAVHEELTPVSGRDGQAARDAARALSAGEVAEVESGGGTAATCPTGIVSEGDGIHNGPSARVDHGADGSGVKVGIISDSYNALGGAATNVANGELPGATNPCGHVTPVQIVKEIPDLSVGVDEGRAMSQIVHDLAPGAPLAFASAAGGEVAMANQVKALGTAGAKVIVDDIGYFSESPFQESAVDAAVETVTAGGAAYFSAAGNGTLMVGGVNQSSYEVPNYRPTACPIQIYDLTRDCHLFNSFANRNSFQVQPGGELLLRMVWNEARNNVKTDFDLFIIDRSTGAILGDSFDDNVASGYPLEIADYVNEGGSTRTVSVVVARYGPTSIASPRFRLDVPTGFGIVGADWGAFAGDVIGPSMYGHPASGSGVAVAAVPYHSPGQLESYSSHGPATRCFRYNNYSPSTTIGVCKTTTVGLTATDGTANTFFGRNEGGVRRFYGTSAAAPHAAAVAALVRDARPGCTPAQVIAAMKAGATWLPGYGTDQIGAGRIDAHAAIANLAPCAAATKLRVEAPATGLTGDPVAVRVTALDASDNLATFSGNVAITTSGPSTTTPGPGPLTNGTGVFTVTPQASGNLTITATKVGSPGVTGTSGIVTIGTTDRFHPLTPARIADSRPAPEQVGLYGTPWGPDTTRDVQVTGTGGVPANAAAVAVNLTVAGTTANSYLSIWPRGENQPVVSSLNWNAGQVIANAVTVKVGTGGKVSIFNKAGNAHVLVDVVGYYSLGAGDGYVPLTPSRIIDSRPGPDNVGVYTTPWGGDTTRQITVAGSGGVPADATAVVANVTAVNPTTASFLTLWPAGNAQPNASNLNFVGGQVIPNAVTVKLGTSGRINVFNKSGNVHVILDIVGYFTSTGGAGFHPIAPVRKIDSRPPPEQRGPFGTVWGSGATRTLPLTGGTVSGAATAVLTNITVTGTTSGSHLTVWPTGQVAPTSSSLNWSAGLTIANSVTTKLGTGGAIDVFNNAGNTNVIVDVSGWYG